MMRKNIKEDTDMFKVFKKFNVRKVFKKKKKPLKENYYGSYDIAFEELENGEIFYRINIEGRFRDGDFKTEKK